MTVKVIDRKTNSILYALHFVVCVHEEDLWFDVTTKTRTVKLEKHSFKIKLESE